MDIENVQNVIALSGMVTIATALVKGLWNGEMPSRYVMATVALITAGLMAAGWYGGEISGTPLQLIGQWLMQAGAAMGFREASVAATGGRVDSPLTNFPSRV